MPKEINPKNSSRAMAFELWMKAPNPMVTFFKTLDVTNLLTVSRKKELKLNMLLCYCITKAAVRVEEFYILPVGEKLMQYDTIAVSTIVNNKCGGINFCDIPYAEDLEAFNQHYLDNTSWVYEHCENSDLSGDSMVIGTSAIIETELDGIVGMNTGIFNNPFISWGRYRKKDLRYELPISFQFHHISRWNNLSAVFYRNIK
ncbi:MAG: chloramphenicol acetyltransferase [Ruminococcus sp.]|nr:chloramphenicol acetyltransferase [Ruminococcus sp.]